MIGPRVWKLLQWTGQLIFGVALLVVLFMIADWHKTLQAWRHADAKWWAPAIVVNATYVMLGWLSLTTLIRAQPWRHWLGGLVDYGACQAFSLITPGRVGELALPLILRRNSATPGE